MSGDAADTTKDVLLLLVAPLSLEIETARGFTKYQTWNHKSCNSKEFSINLCKQSKRSKHSNIRSRGRNDQVQSIHRSESRNNFSVFQVRLAKLAAFKYKHGHCNVPTTPTSEYKSLSKRCSNLGSTYLQEDTRRWSRISQKSTLITPLLRKIQLYYPRELSRHASFQDVVQHKILSFPTEP